MSLQDRLPGWIVSAHAAFGVVWTLQIASQIGFPWLFVAANLTLAAIGVAAGFGWFARRRWAAYLAAFYFLVQFPQVFTETFQWSFTLGFAVRVSLGWIGAAEVGINLFALVMLAWIAWRAATLGNSRASAA